MVLPLAMLLADLLNLNIYTVYFIALDNYARVSIIILLFNIVYDFAHFSIAVTGV
jgi:hypothetical protein